MNPVCEARLAQYPELEYVRGLSPEQLRAADPEDLKDAQHQWAASSRLRLTEFCFEKECSATRRTPLDHLPPQDQVFILQSYIRRMTDSAGGNA